MAGVWGYCGRESRRRHSVLRGHLEAEERREGSAFAKQRPTLLAHMSDSVDIFI